jgi:hypothetical protein
MIKTNTNANANANNRITFRLSKSDSHLLRGFRTGRDLVKVDRLKTPTIFLNALLLKAHV